MSLAIVNTWTLTDATGYGPAEATIANTAGHALVAFVVGGSDSGVSGLMPRMAVADDAHNWWVWGGSAGVTSPHGRRVDIWVCANAMAATTVSVTASSVLAGSGGFVCEVSGFPQYAQADFVLQTNGTAATGTLSGTQPGSSDFLLSAAFTFGATQASVTAPTGYTATSLGNLGNSTAGSTGNIYGEAAILPAANAAGAVTATWSWPTSALFSMVLVGFTASPTAPSQPNPNFPAMKVEAAFGWQPYNTTGTMPTWTDITSRCQDEQGATILDAKRGREYELAQPEAGSLKISLENNDGAFNPTNTSSPYYPNVLPEVPIRLSAVWNGQTYGLGYYYASKWPQDFPDRQWGVTTLQGSDLIGTISQGAMPSAYAGEVLADGAYIYCPLGEFYESPHGSLFNNLSRINQKPLVGYNPSTLAAANQLQTGQSLGLAGDPATGIGVTGHSGGSESAIYDQPGAFLIDNSFPSLANGITVEGWVLPADQSLLTHSIPILTIVGAPENYPLDNGIPNGTRLQVLFGGQTGPITINVFTPAGVTVFGGGGTTVGEGLIYFSFCLSASGSTWTASFLHATNSGVPSQPQTFTGGPSTATYAGTLDANILSVGGMTPYSDPTMYLYDYSLGQVAIYPAVVPQARLLSHVITGMNASDGDLIGQRIAKLITWSGLGVPFGIGRYATEPNPALGNADQIAGSALADALYATAQDEGGMYYVPATAVGELWYAPRQSFYNQTSAFTFGDNGTTETPFLPGTGFDFSDTYLFNIVDSQRTISTGSQITISNGIGINQQYSTQGANAVVEDQASEAAYFPRGPLQVDIETTSDADAYDRANWTLAKYKQARLRANQILLDCASNPSIFPVALAIEQGDIVTVNRRPPGWAGTISVQCIVQMVEHQVGPDLWDTTLTLAPYFPDGNVLQCDNSGFNLAGAAIGW